MNRIKEAKNFLKELQKTNPMIINSLDMTLKEFV